MNYDLAIFQDKNIRRIWHENKWWFVIEDIVVALVDSNDPKQYISKMRQRDEELSKGWVQIVHILEVPTAGGKQRMNCSNTEGVLRVIQSIPSPKAEPFRLWLAKVGYERVQEIQDPELAIERASKTYLKKGYSKQWVQNRFGTISARQELTDEWKQRGIDEKGAAILTNEICESSFGMSTAEYKKFKELDKENLRDHMNDLELIFTMLGEASTTAIAKAKDAKGFPENKVAAVEGGTVAGNARKELERKTKQPVANPENYLETPEKEKRKQIGMKKEVKT